MAKISTTQKVIKIGDSRGVILPARELEKHGIKTGTELEVTVKTLKDDQQSKLMQDYQDFVAQYGQTLKNLKDR